MKLWCPNCQEDREVPFHPSREDQLCSTCDRPLVSQLAKNRRRRQPPHHPQPISQASRVQKRKIAEHPFCIACGVERSEWVTIDPAHLTPRSRGGCDKAACVVGLCRRADGSGCHRMFDEGEPEKLVLLSIIVDRLPAELEELQHMLEHLTPVEMVERLANDRTQWEGLAA